MAGFKSCGFKPYLRQRFSASSLGYFSNLYFPIKFKAEAKHLPMYEEDSWGCVALPKKEELTAQFDEDLLGGVVKVIGKAKIYR